MKGLFKRLSILTASLAMVFGVGLVNNEKKNAKAVSETLTISNFNNVGDTSTKTISLTPCDVTWKKNGGSNIVTTSSEIRIYAKHSMEFSINDGYQINSIVATISASKYVNVFGDQSITGATKSINGLIVTLTPDTDASSIVINQASQARVTQFVINYDVAGAQTITLDKSSSIMKVKDSLTLTATPSEEGATISWESSDTEVATVAKGVVTALKAGTTTITATFGTASASCKILVNPEHSGTSADDPLTVAEAKVAIDAGFTSEVYVKGIITNTEYNSSYSNYEKVYVVDSTDDTTNTFYIL